MIMQNKIVLVLYTIIILCTGAYLYKIKNDILFFFDSPLQATYLNHNIDKKVFIFDVFKYGIIEVPYEAFGANKYNSSLIDEILKINNISYVVYINNGNNSYEIYFAHSGRSILLNAFLPLFFSNTKQIIK